MFYQKMLLEQQKLTSKITALQKKLAHFPKENLICTKNGNRYKWYVSDGKHCTYLPKKEQDLASRLALKKLLTFQLEDAINERASVNAYLRTRHPEKSTAQFHNHHPGFASILATSGYPVSDDLSRWAQAPFEHNPKNPAALVHKSLSGHVLRSKSEVFIDTALYTNRIPFRYECALHLGDLTFYPDFTIRHPRTGKIYYWEHFGRMDDSSYARNSCEKLQTYTSHGIIPTINLITTYETLDHPLTTDVVEEIVQKYFL